MSPLLALLLLLVAFGGAGVVMTRDPLRQALASSFFGLALAVLFLALHAPDVAISQIAVGAVVVPLMVVLTLAKVRELALERRAREEDGGPESHSEEGG